MLLAAILALSPVGLEVLHSAFFAGEQLARNIAQATLLTALTAIVLLVALEWLVRMIISRRRGRGVRS